MYRIEILVTGYFLIQDTKRKKKKTISDAEYTKKPVDSSDLYLFQASGI